MRSQVDLHDDVGFIGRVDFLVDDWVIVEFDGLVKYAGAAGQGALVREKTREDRLRRLGYEVERVIWSELDDPVSVVRRVERSRRVARQRRAGAGPRPGATHTTSRPWGDIATTPRVFSGGPGLRG